MSGHLEERGEGQLCGGLGESIPAEGRYSQCRDREGPSATNHCKDVALALSEEEAIGGFRAKEGCDPTPFKQDPRCLLCREQTEPGGPRGAGESCPDGRGGWLGPGWREVLRGWTHGIFKRSDQIFRQTGGSRERSEKARERLGYWQLLLFHVLSWGGLGEV